MHQQLHHPSVTRLLHFVRTRNLPFSASDVREVCRCCCVCADLKPNAWERLYIYFKGPVKGANLYVLMSLTNTRGLRLHVVINRLLPSSNIFQVCLLCSVILSICTVTEVLFS